MSAELSTIQAHIEIARDCLRKAESTASRGTRYEATRNELRAALHKLIAQCDEAMRITNIEYSAELRDADRRAQVPPPPPAPGPESAPRPPRHRPVS